MNFYQTNPQLNQKLLKQKNIFSIQIASQHVFHMNKHYNRLWSR